MFLQINEKECTYFEWVRNRKGNTNSVWFTESNFEDIKKIDDSYKEKYKVAFLLECYDIHPDAYSWILKNDYLFDYVITHKEALVKKNPRKYLWHPFGGCWIKPEDTKIYDKTKLVSSICSNKKITYGHRLRHKATQLIANEDRYGHGYKTIPYKLDGLKDYAFSIVVENNPDWFTEKLIDCFACGTIPIYWGKLNIDKYFDDCGIIQFETIDELKDEILPSLSMDLYRQLNKQNNFKLVEEYRCGENWLFENYPFLFENTK